MKDYIKLVLVLGALILAVVYTEVRIRQLDEKISNVNAQVVVLSATQAEEVATEAEEVVTEVEVEATTEVSEASEEPTEVTTEATTQEVTTETAIIEPQTVLEASTMDFIEEDEEICTEEPNAVYEASEGLVYVGEYELTAYEWTGCPCADGVYPQEGYTVASNDPNLWHRWINIDGYGNYYVHDTGGMSVNVIDIYLGDPEACVQFGRRSASVYLIN